MLLIINSFSFSISKSFYSDQLEKLKFLIQQKKDSKEMLKKEFEDFKNKFEKKEYTQFKEILEMKNYYDDVLENLSKNIVKIHQSLSNYSSFDKDIKNVDKPIFLEISQNSKLAYMSRELNITYGDRLREWEDRINNIISNINQKFPDSKNSFIHFKLKKLEQKFGSNTNKTIIKTSDTDSLNIDHLMQDLDLSIKSFFHKLKYLNEIPDKDNKITKELNIRIEEEIYKAFFLNRLKEKFDKLNITERVINYKYNNISKEALANELISKISSFLNSFFFTRLSFGDMFIYAKKRLNVIVNLFGSVITINYDPNDNSQKELIKNQNVDYSYLERICNDISRFYSKLVLYLNNTNFIDIPLLNIEKSLKYFPLLNKSNKTDIVRQSQKHIPTKEEILKEMEVLKIVCQFIIKNEVSISRSKFDTFNKFYEIFDKEEYDSLTIFRNYQTDSTGSVDSDFNDIVSILSNRYNDLSFFFTRKLMKYDSLKFFYKYRQSNLISFLDSEFQNKEKNLNINRNLDNLSFINLLEIIYEDYYNIGSKIYDLKQLANNQTKKTNGTSNYPFDILYNLKFIYKKPFLFYKADVQNKPWFSPIKKNITYIPIKNLNIFIADLINDILNTLNQNSDFIKKAQNFSIENYDKIEKFSAWEIFSNDTNFSIKKLDNDIFELVKTKEIFEKTLKREDNIDKKYFPEYEALQKKRNENGVTGFMNFINNFFDSIKAQNILTNLYKKLNPSSIKTSRLLKNERTSNSQFSTMRIWSSFRFEEALEKTIKKEKDLKLLDVLKISTIAFISDMKPLKCWKDTLEERIYNNFEKKKSGYDVKIGPFNFHLCKDDLYNDKDFCRYKCLDDEIECDSFCSKSNCDSNSIKDFRYKKFREFYNDTHTWKNFIYQKCPYNYIECDDRSCAISKQFCGIGAPIITKKFVDAFVNFMGYVQSMADGKVFAWTDDSGKFNSTVDELENFYFENKNVVDMYENFSLNDRSKMNSDKLIEIFSYLGFEIDDKYVYLNESKKIKFESIRSLISSFLKTEYDYKTFIELRNKGSHGNFQNILLDETVLHEISQDLLYKYKKQPEPTLVVEKYMKLTIRIFKMMVIFQKPQCF
jgi:hypothetical protein